ncbi:lysophospholipid acyltransferase family protein [Megalodesulfovibrio paquesii]
MRKRGPYILEASPDKPVAHAMLKLFGPLLECVTQISGVNDIHSRAVACSGPNFWANVIEAMRVTIQISDEARARIPATGPVVVVANHPYGGIEGIILGALLMSIRPDVMVMGNYLLSHIPELTDRVIFVDNFGSSDSLKKNIQPLKQSIRTLRDGHMLAIFPAGEVSSLDVHRRRIMDPPWNPTVARIIQKTGAPVLPIFFPGHNGLLFNAAGLIHPRLRTLLLPRELVRREGRTFQVQVGSLIPAKKLARYETEQQLLAYLRLRTYMLDKRPDSPGGRPRFRLLSKLKKKVLPAPNNGSKRSAPIEQSQDPAVLAAEVARLPPENLLAETGKFKAYVASAQEVPAILQEIGRLREVTFRLVGEGTGKSIDLDRYDQYYAHLFIWNAEANEVVGAYRVGKSSKIIEEHGIEGLYTSTLFSFKPQLFERMGPALEMGRSFVRPEYQRSIVALPLLWKGIANYVLLHPDYKVLFGPVSISNDYTLMSREMIVRFLRENNSLSEFSKLVKPRKPPRLRCMKLHEIREFRAVLSNMDDVAEVVSDIEPEAKGIPVLLKQYLKLGGKILSFNVDPDFNNCLDGLIYVDLVQTPVKTLAMYMGIDNVYNLHDYHAAKQRPPVCTTP